MGNVQVPGYLENQDKLKAAGVQEVIVYCVNDGAVMQAWAKDQGIDGSMITFMGDPHASLTKAMGMELTHAGPAGVGIVGRCKRHSFVVDDGTIKVFKISEKENDPAGDDFPEDTCAPAMLASMAGLKGEL